MSETAQTPELSPMLTHSLMTGRRPTKNLTPHRTDAEDHEREIFRLELKGKTKKEFKRRSKKRKQKTNRKTKKNINSEEEKDDNDEKEEEDAEEEVEDEGEEEDEEKLTLYIMKEELTEKIMGALINVDSLRKENKKDYDEEDEYDDSEEDDNDEQEDVERKDDEEQKRR
ncbi:hypothetical protein QE152_g18886 [Popillia japonica]|uniref:Uncharacterized protein n=1 Tax=Popillia japonica TaxID=7064 RepID=A0AAW1L566_POPJA